MQVKKQQLELDMEQWTGSKLGKEYIKAVCFHPAYLTYIQNARQNEAQAGIKIAGRNITNLRYADNTSVMAESEQELKSLLMTVKEESEKLGLKLNIQKTHVNPWLIHVDVWQKPSQYCKVISLQLNKLKKTQHSKNEDHGIRCHHFMANRWGNNGNSETLFSWAPKSLKMVTVAMKLKDACSLEE